MKDFKEHLKGMKILKEQGYFYVLRLGKEFHKTEDYRSSIEEWKKNLLKSFIKQI